MLHPQKLMMNLRTQFCSATLTLGLCLFGLQKASADSLFTLDGIYDPSNDGYTHQFVLPIQLDDKGTIIPTDLTSTLKVGIGKNADNVTGGTNDLFVYFEVPLELKDMTWGDGTHDGYSESSNDVENGRIAMNQNTGSEKIAFQWGENDVEVKLSQRGAGKDQSEIDDAIADGSINGHELKEDGGGAVIGAATSLDFIMKKFPNTTPYQYWGDVSKDGGDSTSNSPLLKQELDENGDLRDVYETVDPLLSKWPFHQSWELQIQGDFEEDDLANLFKDKKFFGESATDGNFLLHASPVKQGFKADIVPTETPEIEPIPPTVPEPSSLVLFAAFGLLGLGTRRRR